MTLGKQDDVDLRGYLEIDDQDAHAFRKRYFILDREEETLDFYREDPLVGLS